MHAQPVVVCHCRMDSVAKLPIVTILVYVASVGHGWCVHRACSGSFYGACSWNSDCVRLALCSQRHWSRVASVWGALEHASMCACVVAQVVRKDMQTLKAGIEASAARGRCAEYISCVLNARSLSAAGCIALVRDVVHQSSVLGFWGSDLLALYNTTSGPVARGALKEELLGVGRRAISLLRSPFVAISVSLPKSLRGQRTRLRSAGDLSCCACMDSCLPARRRTLPKRCRHGALRWI